MAQLPKRGLQAEGCLGMWLLNAALLVGQVLMYFCRPLTLLPSPATPVPLLQVGPQARVASGASSAARGPPVLAPPRRVSSLHPPGAWGLATDLQQPWQQETRLDSKAMGREIPTQPTHNVLPSKNNGAGLGRYSWDAFKGGSTPSALPAHTRA